MHWAKTLERNLELTLDYVDQAARAGSRVVLFPEANLTGYYFPYLIQLPPALIQSALDQLGAAAKRHDIWIIAGNLGCQFTSAIRSISRYNNLIAKLA